MGSTTNLNQGSITLLIIPILVSAIVTFIVTKFLISYLTKHGEIVQDTVKPNIPYLPRNMHLCQLNMLIEDFYILHCISTMINPQQQMQWQCRWLVEQKALLIIIISSIDKCNRNGKYATMPHLTYKHYNFSLENEC